jgi:penicillin-binding protein-related factor A (putative recombinase)
MEQPKSATDLEGKVNDWFVSAQEVRPLIFERILDSKAAGNLVKRAPADFYFLYNGRFAYLEAKFSEKHVTLRSCLSSAVRPHQLASARLVQRAGGRYWFLFYSKVSEQYEIWDGMYCAARKRAKIPLDLADARRFEAPLDSVLLSVLEIT